MHDGCPLVVMSELSQKALIMDLANQAIGAKLWSWRYLSKDVGNKVFLPSKTISIWIGAGFDL